MNLSPNPIVYVVDDDDAVRDSVQVLLESYGFETKAFASAQQFLAAFDATTAGCLVLDMHMPEISGLELLEILRTRRISIPVVAFSGRADAALEALVTRAGALVLLAKPVADDELIAFVKRAVEQRGTH